MVSASSASQCDGVSGERLSFSFTTFLVGVSFQEGCGEKQRDAE